MPYADPERQQEYYRQRQERRKIDQEFKDARNARFRQRWADDPALQERQREASKRWRRKKRLEDPEWHAREKAQSLRAGRKYRGMRWSEADKAAFDAITACEVCGRNEQMHADHCHDCGAYRGGLCRTCNHHEGILRKWQAVCPPGSPMRIYMDRHVCEVASEPAA